MSPVIPSPIISSFSVLVKAKPPTGDGRRLLEIQGSVELEDAEGDLILQKALLNSADKFIATGHIDVDHLYDLGEQYGIPNPESWIVGRPIDVWARGNETWVLAEIFSSPTGDFNPDRNKADAIWKSLTDNPPAQWKSSVFGYMGSDTEDCRSGFCPSGPSRFLVKSFDWCGLALTKNPVNNLIKNHARIVAAKSYLNPEMIALVKAGRSSLDGLFDQPEDPKNLILPMGSGIKLGDFESKAAGWIQNPARPGMDSVRTSFDCGTCGALLSAPRLPILKSHFMKCLGMDADMADLHAHAGMYHHLLQKAGYFAPTMRARATGRQGATPPMIYGPGNESLDWRDAKLKRDQGRRGSAS